MEKVVLFSRLTYEVPVVVGTTEVGGKEYENTVHVTARGKTTVEVEDLETFKKSLPAGITVVGG